MANSFKSSLKGFKWMVTALTIILNLFIYFYPEILNDSDQCTWAKFKDDDSNDIRPKSNLSFLNKGYLPDLVTEKLLLNFPSLQANKTEPLGAYHDLSTSSQATTKVKDIHMLAFGDPQINGNWKSTKYIKRLDNYGNDYYLGHIYNVMQNRLKPSHVAVMGDLFSSQWIYETEFYNRTYRFVERLFPRPLDHKQNVIDTWTKHENYDWHRFMNDEHAMDPTHRYNSRVYNDVYDWFNPESKAFPNFDNPLFINLTGNHDIGYSGDATWQHMARFHHLFGQNNYVINYNQGKPEEWRLVVLDSLTMEGPGLQQEFIDYTWSFIDHLNKDANPNFKGSTVLLTHIPFFKKAGLCADGPQHIYYVNNTNEPYKNGKLRSQNHLSYETSQKVLDIVFPNPDKEGIILTGHDHVGCDNWYSKDASSGDWIADKSKDESVRAPIREIVVRSMMGDFNGQTGIFTGHFDYIKSNWKFEFSYCSFTVQHWWWATKVTTLVSVLLHSIAFLTR